MSKPPAEQIIDAGLAAQRIAPLIEQIARERTAHIVEQLITQYKARDLTTERLWAAVGALAEHAEILATNERKVKALYSEQDKSMRGSR